MLSTWGIGTEIPQWRPLCEFVRGLNITYVALTIVIILKLS